MNLRIELLAGLATLTALGCDGMPPPAMDGGVPPADAAPLADAGPRDAGPFNAACVTDAPAQRAAATSATCGDGMYSEPAHARDADIADLVASYDAARAQEFAIAVLERRYPFGAYVVREGVADTEFDCFAGFVEDASTAQGVLDSLATVVHECGHALDELRATGEQSHFQLTESVGFTCDRGESMSFGGRTIPNRLIAADSYAAARPPCDDATGEVTGCDLYATTYLDYVAGDPNRQIGEQGFASMLEEANQYITNVATAYSFNDLAQQPGAHDGALTFLFWIERYLRLARTEYAAAYEALAGDACWRDAILAVWGRAWLWLERTNADCSLSFDGGALMRDVMNPELLGEIGRLRERAGCR